MILGKQVLCRIGILILPVIPEERKLMHACLKLNVIPIISQYTGTGFLWEHVLTILN